MTRNSALGSPDTTTTPRDLFTCRLMDQFTCRLIVLSGTTIDDWGKYLLVKSTTGSQSQTCRILSQSVYDLHNPKMLKPACASERPCWSNLHHLFYKYNRRIYNVFMYWTTRHRVRVKSQRREYRDTKWNGTVCSC